jgi:hypothetical protein
MKLDQHMTARLATTLHLVGVSVLYVGMIWPVLGDPFLWLTHDNLIYHLPAFVYFSASLDLGHGLPLWYTSFGGYPVSITSASLFPFMPHKLFGYALYAVTGLDAMSVYKLSITAGMLMTGGGWWLVLRRLTGSRPAATFGTLILLLGGTGITIFHQEQALCTVFLVPWMLLCLMKLREDISAALPLAVLLGISMTIHYPQIHLVAFLLLMVSLVMTGHVRSDLLHLGRSRPLVLLLAVVLFFAAALPAIPVARLMEDFASPIRGRLDLAVESLSDYVRLNTIDRSSAAPGYLRNYLLPQVDVRDDQFVFFITTLGAMFAALGIMASLRRSLVVLVMAVLLLWATLGIHAYLPHVLYLIHVPFIKYFRQWYHFAPLTNMALSALAALGLAAVLHRLRRAGRPAALAPMLTLVLLGFVWFDARGYFQAYAERAIVRADAEYSRPSAPEFEALLKRESFANALLETRAPRLARRLARTPYHLVLYRDWLAYREACPPYREASPFSTGVAFTYDKTGEGHPARLTQVFCSSGLREHAVLLDPPVNEGELRSVTISSIDFSEAQGTFVITDMPDERIEIPASADYRVLPSGAALQGSVSAPGLLVLPLNHKLGLKAMLNGIPVKTFSAMGGAATAVPVDSGDFSLNLRAPWSIYQWGVILQGILLCASGAWAIRKREADG